MFRAFCVLILDTFLSASWYKPLHSVIILAYTHQYCTYFISSSRILQHRMVRGRVSLEGTSAYEAIVAHEEQFGSAVKQQGIENALPNTEPQSIRSYSFHEKEGSDTLSDILIAE